jgi:hypothetical protein
MWYEMLGDPNDEDNEGGGTEGYVRALLPMEERAVVIWLNEPEDGGLVILVAEVM